MEVDFKSRSGRVRSDPSKAVSKDDLSSLETKLKEVEDSLADIGREIDFARRQELLLKEAGGISFVFFFHILILNMHCSLV